MVLRLYLINTDGAPLVESRNFSIWPVLATVVELNQSSREKFTNIINLGIWLHSSKPKNEMMNGTKPKALWT
jgi:hypothetical protein